MALASSVKGGREAGKKREKGGKKKKKEGKKDLTQTQPSLRNT